MPTMTEQTRLNVTLYVHSHLVITETDSVYFAVWTECL